MEDIFLEIADTMKTISSESYKNDRALLDLISALIDRVNTLERRVDMLMELHIIPSDVESLENQ